MAFVYRSTKSISEFKKFQNNLPPLKDIDYETAPEITKKYFSKNNFKTNNAPFGVKASKDSLKIKYNSNSPGPGSYQIQENFLKKSFNQNLTSPFDPESIEGNPQQLFISKERRFKNINKTDNDINFPVVNFSENTKNFEKKTFPQYPKSKIYKLYDPHRKISIPSDDFYFEVKNNGDVEVKQDIDDLKKNWNHTGPGSYNVKYFNKNNNSIDWSRTVNDIKKDKNKINDKLIEDIDNLKINTQLNTYNRFKDSLQSTSNNNTGIRNSTKALNCNLEKLANKICNTEINNSEEKTKRDKVEMKDESVPGPGDYDIPPYLNVPICFSNVTNFGSNSSRGLLYPNKDNKILIGDKDTKFFTVIKNNKQIQELNKSLEIRKSPINSEIKPYKKNNNKLKLHYDSYKIKDLYINNLKERNILNKKILMDQIGPGSYDPSFSLYKNRNDNDIQSFGVLEKRFKENPDKINIPGVGTYSLQKSFIKKKPDYFSPIPSNIVKKDIEGISGSKVQEMKMQIFSENHKQPGVWNYYPEMMNSINYRVYKEANSSGKKPGFISGEKRFFEPSHKYEDENQVGKYNLLFKEKEFNQQASPFGSKAEKFECKIKPKSIGPGAYRYDSYFDWNKKSYNMLFNV